MSDRMKRTLIIETEVDRKTLNNSEQVVKDFFDKYSDKTMKVSTPDFQGILQPIRDIEKEIDRVTEKMPHMLGSIAIDKTFVSDIKEAFTDISVTFTDGSIAKGFDDIIEKSKTLAIKSVDLGKFVSTLQYSVRSSVDALKQIGAIQSNYNGKNYLDLSGLNVQQLQDAIELMQQLKKSQEELDIFYGEPLTRDDLYSGTTTSVLSSRLEKAKTDLDELKRLNLETTSELAQRKDLQSEIDSGAYGKYDDWQFNDIKDAAQEDEVQYHKALLSLQEYVAERSELLQRLQDNSSLFTNSELEEYTNTLTGNIDRARLQIQELQQIGWDVRDNSNGGDFSRIIIVLNEIKASLQSISNVFKNEDASMRTMAENGVTSFNSLSAAIVAVYNNLSQLERLVNSISQKDFNITNVTQVGSSADSNLQAMTQQMAIARETQEHLRVLFDQASDTLTLLSQNGHIGLVMEYAKQLQELNMTDISKSIKGANTEMKLASVLAEMQDYIDKLIQINELRNKYNLGEWKDTFVSTQQSIVQPEAHVDNANALQQEAQAQQVLNEARQEANTPQGGAEAQQMVGLKNTVDEVATAIGRKNAGFIKEKEIVDASVEAEKTKLKELIVVITNEIGGALDNIKARFAQSFIVPELEEDNLQASFDKIYNKFIELKNKVETMQIDIGINGSNITTAIQEAIYAKEIAQNYKKITSFDQVFGDFTWGYDAEAMNNFTGEIFALDEAQEEFEKKWKNKFVSTDGSFIGSAEEMMSNLMQKLNDNVNPNQNEWAKIIVEAINTQGNNIVEAIKVILPQGITGSIGNGDSTIDETKITDAFQTLSQTISAWSNDTRLPPGEFFELLRKQQWSRLGEANTFEVKEALRTLGLMSNTNQPTFTIADQGLRNLGVAIADKFVLPTRSAYLDQTSELIPLLNEASQLGASVPRIISAFNDGSRVFELQTRMLGKNIASDKTNPEFLNATNEQIDKLIHTFEVLSKVGLYPDFIGDNILFDKNAGFSLVDLETSNISRNSMDTPEDMMQAFLQNALRGLNIGDRNAFRARVSERLSLPPEQRLINESNVSANKIVETPNEVKIVPTMEEGAVAKVVSENVQQTPATVNVTPVFDTKDNEITDSASNTEQSVNNESQSAIDAAKSFVDAANAKKQFVEANKKVAESAQSSEGAVKKEAEAAKKVAADIGKTASKVSKDLAKIKNVYNNDDELIQTDTTRKFKTDKAVVSETKSARITTDADGNEVQTIITTIVKDFEKFNQEEKKTEEAIARAQSKLDEFIKKFKSKTGGNAQFIEGFNELSNFKINKDNIEDAFNKITQLQARYNELEGNFRKGQSSLNPFTNAITKASNIDNIFGDVEFKFNSLSNKSDELVNKFTRLQEVSKKIKDFVDIINTNPNSITPDQFTEFSKYVGEFNLLKTQVEGSIKREKRIETEDSKQQVEAYKEILRLVKERNDALAKAAKSDSGSIKQKNALYDAYKIQQQLHILGKQIVLTDEQRTELARVREEQARRIRDIEAEIATKNANQKTAAKEQIRAKEVQDYINLIKQKNEYELKAAKGGAMQSFYNEKVNDIKNKIAKNDKQAIMNQEEKNRLVAIEEEHQRKIAELQAKSNSSNSFQKENDTLQKKFEAGYLSEAKFNNWKNELNAYQNYLNGTVAADEATIQKAKASLAKLYDQLNKLSNASKTFFASGGEILSKQFNKDEINNAKESLSSLYKDIVSDRFGGMKTTVTGFNDVNSSIAKLTFTVDDGKGALSSYSIILNKITGDTKLVSGQTKEAATTLQKFGAALKGDIRGIFTAFIGGMSILHTVGRYIKDGIQSVKELDAALTELKKVTDETEETYDQFLKTAGKTGARIGSTLTNMVSATAEFAKLGYDIEQASKMAESALVYTNVGDDVDVDTGSQSIISTMKAFGIEANNTMSIVDKFNEVKFLLPYTVMYM